MDSRIRILFTIPNFKTAGSQYVLLSLINSINQKKFDAFVVVESFPELIPDAIPLNRRLVFSFRADVKSNILAFRRIIRQNKINIVHSWDYKSNYVEALACRFSGVKYLYTKKNNSWSRKWKLKSLFSNFIAYDNPEMKLKFFNSLLFQNKTIFIPHGVDTNRFKPLEKKPRDNFIIGCIGTINSNKNQLFLIKVLNNLPTNIVLHIYGKEEKTYKKILDEHIEKLNIQDRIRFFGDVENSQIPEIFRGIDLFILASFQEGLPVSILESMACGVPVLASKSGGGTEYLLDKECLFDLNDENCLINQVMNFFVMADDQKKMISGELVRSIFSKHSLEKEVWAYEKLYQSILRC